MGGASFIVMLKALLPSGTLLSNVMLSIVVQSVGYSECRGALSVN